EYRTTEEFGHPVPATRDPEKAWPRRLVPVFVAVAALSVAVTLLPAGLGWLGSLAPAAPGATSSAPAVPEVPEIAARSAASFETSTLIVPADREFELVFHNEQDGVPHDVAIANGPDLGTMHFNGEEITGPDTVTYQVPALAQGSYYFLCTVHPNMNGTVEARPQP
ncbi:MAG TPA: cupredoxin domain-containing protein, partial [Candidatus Caenarcaniphilales bacterium]|nr:cupredoxin domain-containing protein [Candidatus Caenarcaniphilales bacterium]